MYLKWSELSEHGFYGEKDWCYQKIVYFPLTNPYPVLNCQRLNGDDEKSREESISERSRAVRGFVWSPTAVSEPDREDRYV